MVYFSRLMLAILVSAQLVSCTAQSFFYDNLGEFFYGAAYGAAVGVVGTIGYQTFKDSKKIRPRYTVQFLDYDEERDLENIKDLYKENHQFLAKKEFSISEYLHMVLPKGPKPIRPSWVKCEQKETYVKVAYVGHSFVGFIIYEFPESLIIPSREQSRSFLKGHISMFVIENFFRKRGYGKIFLDVVMHELKEKGVQIIDLDVFTNNESAIQFYKKNGFEEAGRSDDLVSLVKILSPELTQIINLKATP